jgi:hypothetical protein
MRPGCPSADPGLAQKAACVSSVSAQGTVVPGGDEMPTWLLVLIIVLVVLALFGGFGYYRR